jgi:hypothetical protein
MKKEGIEHLRNYLALLSHFANEVTETQRNKFLCPKRVKKLVLFQVTVVQL